MGRCRGRVRAAAITVAASLLLVPVGAEAIIGGHKDGGGHPNVGLVAALDAHGALIDACTGTLVAPTVVLTAAHCVGGKQLGLVDHYVVSFKPQAVQNGVVTGAISGRPTPNARFNLRFKATGDPAAFYRNSQFDVGVLVLERRADKVYPGIRPALLPAKGALDRYLEGTGTRVFTHVGYGLPASGVFDGIRRTVSSPFSQLTGTLLFTQGGICSGDSGGPVFDAAGALMAVAAFVDGDTCASAAGGPRLDIELNRGFLRKFGVV